MPPPADPRRDLDEEVTISACQSCSRPFTSPDDSGTNADGSPSERYCGCCLAAGQWVEPDVTMDALQERCIEIWVSHALASEAHAREHFAALFPTLERWR